MTTQGLSNFYDALSATGVIISFVYLAYQIRQNTRAMRRSAAREIVRDLNSLSQYLIQQPDLARLYLKTIEQPQELSSEERFRFQLLLSHAFSNFDLALEYHTDGLISSDSIEIYVQGIFRLFENSVVKEWWEVEGRPMFSQKMRNLAMERAGV